MATEPKIDNQSKAQVDFEKEFRLSTESKRQWDLRKRFIETYWDKYDQDRLLCLARQ